MYHEISAGLGLAIFEVCGNKFLRLELSEISAGNLFLRFLFKQREKKQEKTEKKRQSSRTGGKNVASYRGLRKWRVFG